MGGSLPREACASGHGRTHRGIRGKDPVIPMAMSPRRRHPIQPRARKMGKIEHGLAVRPGLRQI